MTIKQLIDSIADCITEPAQEGISGQMLTTDGHGGRTWTGAQRTITAQKLIINGKQYTVRTGTAGAKGYLTIAANTIYLDKKQVELKLGTSDVTKIFGGTSEIYSAATGYYQIYYNGYKNGITWRGNYLPRPQYTGYGEYSFANAETSSGYILVYIGSGTGYSNNAHVITTAPVTVPAKATTMHVYCRNNNDNTINMQFGLLPANAPNSYSTANGGILSSTFAITGTTWKDCTLSIPASIRGATNLYPIINGKGNSDVQRAMRIAWVWFD